MKIKLNVYLILLCLFHLTKTEIISDEDYALMPLLFHMDNYDYCMQEKNALYCSFIYKLQPLEESEKLNNTSFKIWNTIKETISNPKYYRHDYLRHWICVKHSCQNVSEDSDSLKQEINDCYNRKYKNLGLTGNITNLSCRIGDSSLYTISIYDIIIGLSIVSYLFFVIVASFYEGIARYKPKHVYEELTSTKIGTIISSFSIPKNFYRLRNSNSNPEVRKLRSIQGIRFFNMICVIMCHTCITYLSVPVLNPKYVETITEKPLNMFIANGGVAVQTFFLISGWLLSYHFFQMAENKRTIKLKYILVALINRYIRLIPALSVIVALHSTWLVHLSDGPYWSNIVGKEYEACKKNWWHFLLFINNYIDFDNTCLPQMWYIAADTQLFLLSLILISILWKYKKHIKYILGIALVFACSVPGIISYLNGYYIIIKQEPEFNYELHGLGQKAWKEMYASTYTNIGGYLVGVTFGYIYYKYDDIKFHIRKIHIVLWWIITYGISIFIVLIASIMYYDNFITRSTILSALYWSLGRNVFAICIATGIYGITQGIGYFTKWICEWKSIQIFGKITYSAYVVHAAIARVRIGQLRQPLYISDFGIFHTTLGDIALSYMVAFILCLVVEMPISALQKLFVPQLAGKRRKALSEKSMKTIESCQCLDVKTETSKL